MHRRSIERFATQQSYISPAIEDAAKEMPEAYGLDLRAAALRIGTKVRGSGSSLALVSAPRART